MEVVWYIKYDKCSLRKFGKQNLKNYLYLYTDTLTPSVVSSFNLRTFFSLLWSAVSLLAAFASSWAFWRLAICSRTWASILVGSWTASVPNTRIKFDILSYRQRNRCLIKWLTHEIRVQTKSTLVRWIYLYYVFMLIINSNFLSLWTNKFQYVSNPISEIHICGLCTQERSESK